MSIRPARAPERAVKGTNATPASARMVANRRLPFSPEQMATMRANGLAWQEGRLWASRMTPVARLTAGDREWLVAAVHPGDADRFLAACDMADGQPQVRWVQLSEVLSNLGGRGPAVTLDPSFSACGTLQDRVNETRRRAMPAGTTALPMLK